MARDVQITTVTLLRGRCDCDEFLKGITLSIFFENEKICLRICIFVEQQHLFIFLNLFIHFSIGYGS